MLRWTSRTRVRMRRVDLVCSSCRPAANPVAREIVLLVAVRQLHSSAVELPPPNRGSSQAFAAYQCTNRYARRRQVCTKPLKPGSATSERSDLTQTLRGTLRRPPDTARTTKSCRQKQ